MQLESTQSSTLAMLQSLYPGVVLIDTQQVAVVVGLSPKTIRNLKDKFPIPSLKIGDSRRYRLVDVANVIDSGLGLKVEVKPQAAQDQTQTQKGSSGKSYGEMR